MRRALCGLVLGVAVAVGSGCTSKPVVPEKPVSDPLFTSKLNLNETPPAPREGGK